MGPPRRLLCLAVTAAGSQVFVVGEKSATATSQLTSRPRKLPLPTDKITERGRRELVRNLEAEQGFAHRALPMGAGITFRPTAISSRPRQNTGR